MIEKENHMDIRKDYWDSYYAQIKVGNLKPSQFAVFVESELNENFQVIEVGCGNGRDALYFSSLGYSVIGIDASKNAVAFCQKNIVNEKKNNSFLALDVGNIHAGDIAGNLLEGHQRLVYSRFFIHAITESEEDRFLDFSSKVCQGGDITALEFRTYRDADLKKETAKHYRRFIDPVKVLHKLSLHGFEPYYFVEGFGYAKYRNDDAYVARILARKK